MSSRQSPYSEKDPADLAPDEFQVLTTWRLQKLEEGQAAIKKAAWSIAAGIMVNVIVLLVASGHA